jgi:hypothetical protein
MTLDTRTPQERAYDDLKSGAVYFQPEPVALVARACERAGIAPDAPLTDEAYDRMVAELEAIDQRHGIADDDDAARNPGAVAELKAWIDGHLAAEKIAIAKEAERMLSEHVRVEHLWYNPKNGGACDTPNGEPMYVGYVCGTRDGKAEVSFRVDGKDESPEVFLFGRDGVPIDEVLATLPSLMRLLEDPRVQAHLAAYNERLGETPV